MVVFLKDPIPYLREFREKPRETLNGYVDIRGRRSNPAPLTYQFWQYNLSAIGRAQLEMDFTSESYATEAKGNC